MRVDSSSIWERIAWGATWGAILGLACSLAAVARFVAQGADAAMRYGLTLPMLICAYLVGCSIAGSIVGLLTPIARSKPGAAVIGFLALLPIGLAIQLLTLGNGRWEAVDTFVVVVGSLAIGMPSGLIYREMFAGALSTRDQGKGST